MTVVIDYGAGNLRSVENALKMVGAEFRVTEKPEEVYAADKVIFPGVGEASSSMKKLIKGGLDKALKDFAVSGKPFLGICLGCQIILDRSEEAETPCLGIIPGNVRLFPSGLGLKVPHMGWNSLHLEKPDPLFHGIPEGADFYFVHSYYPQPRDSETLLATCTYGLPFSAGFRKGNVYGFQFHPEKSGPYGLTLLRNFIALKEPESC
ncbi:MAG: imidazole glycerol phosphate synthase subunit HisH [Spirochaetales bacterium]|nr:imidazole glycerol phosphate synthase subunit HisH [Spirochaetales bacterium]